MSHNWPLYIIAFAMSLFITLFTTPVAKKLSIKFGAIDYPKDRGIHKKPMPRMGGVAIVFGFMVTVFVLIRFVDEVNYSQFIGLVVGSLIIAVLGMVDDTRNLPARFKLAVQIIAAIIVVISGTRMHIIQLPMNSFLRVFSIPITIIWIVGVTNAVNLIDGMDGLASGVSAIASLCIMILCFITGSEMAVFLSAVLAGSCIGFLPRNFNPAEIFMGDTGSTFLGFVLAVTSIMGVFKGYTILALVVTILCLGLPIFDTLFAIGRRVKNHKPIMQPDRGHMHHRLIDKGFSQKQAAVILYGVSAICGLVAIIIIAKSPPAIVITIIMVVGLSYVIHLFMKRNHNRRR
ncbi:MAG: undecaprenyl/decaprenyl-phosphate alpha-N-acetylglucosaminyl 1-phosphate transferase [Firmicutes bacterium]|nr:undecaprenyl/decaprenyl-phosphate alpha-N-acetylglucosaminyl 1-phosphate transferase [Bacillota bacterium]